MRRGTTGLAAVALSIALASSGHAVKIKFRSGIRGTVYERVGRGVGSKPVEGACVRIAIEGKGGIYGEYTTRSKGSFMIPAPSGRYKLWAAHPSFGNDTTKRTVSVPPGKWVSKNITLVKGSDRGIRGKVTAVSIYGPGIAEARVQYGANAYPAHAHCYTAPDGTYELRLTMGYYSYAVTHPDYESVVSVNAVSSPITGFREFNFALKPKSDTGQPPKGKPPKGADKGDDQNASPLPSGPYRLGGLVAERLPGGAFLPIKGAAVVVSTAQTKPAGTTKCVTNGKGRYLIDLPAGEYHVKVSCAGYFDEAYPSLLKVGKETGGTLNFFPKRKPTK